MNATQDADSRMHTPHEQTNEDTDLSPGGGGSDTNAHWMGSGDHDFGGGNGTSGDDTAVGSLGTRFQKTDVSTHTEGAIGRPLNTLMLGATMVGNEAFDVFRCPGNEGQ